MALLCLMFLRPTASCVQIHSWRRTHLGQNSCFVLPHSSATSGCVIILYHIIYKGYKQAPFGPASSILHKQFQGSQKLIAGAVCAVCVGRCARTDTFGCYVELTPASIGLACHLSVSRCHRISGLAHSIGRE